MAIAITFFARGVIPTLPGDSLSTGIDANISSSCAFTCSGSPLPVMRKGRRLYARDSVEDGGLVAPRGVLKIRHVQTHEVALRNINRRDTSRSASGYGSGRSGTAFTTLNSVVQFWCMRRCCGRASESHPAPDLK